MKALAHVVFSVLVFLLIFWIAGFAAFFVHVKGFSLSGNEKADAIIVLTGGPDRVNAGLTLLSQGRADYLFISGVNEKVKIEELLDLWHKESGISSSDPCCIVIGHEAMNTSGNAAEASAWMKANNLTSALLITADYHMPRAWLEFTSLMPRNEFYPHAILSKKINRILLVEEYNKTLYTFARLKFLAGAR